MFKGGAYIYLQGMTFKFVDENLQKVYMLYHVHQKQKFALFFFHSKNFYPDWESRY